MASRTFSEMLSSVTRFPHFQRQITQRNKLSTMSPLRESLPLGAVFKSDAGRNYNVEEILADRGKPLLSIYRASGEGEKYLVKHTLPDDLGYQVDLQKRLSLSPNIRTFVDTVQERELCIYPYMTGDLLQLALKDLSKDTRRNILRMALNGLADMHDKDIIHNDIKPNNILVNYEKNADGLINVQKVQISDLDDMVVVPPKKWLCGPLCGNQIWRSPESWCKSGQNHTSDVFSFGVVMIYVMIKEMIFLLPRDQLEAEDAWRPILRRHISYFADLDSFKGFLAHIGEKNSFVDRLLELFDTFKDKDLREPVTQWQYLEPNFRDLVSKMTVMEPRKRISAREALQHPWWNQAL